MSINHRAKRKQKSNCVVLETLKRKKLFCQSFRFQGVGHHHGMINKFVS